MRAVSRDRSEGHGNSRGRSGHSHPLPRLRQASSPVQRSRHSQRGHSSAERTARKPTGAAGQPPSGGRSPCGHVSLAALCPEPPGKVSGRGGSGSPALGSCSKGLPGTPGASHKTCALSCRLQHPSAKPAACFWPRVWGGADHLTTEHQMSTARVALHELPSDPTA